MTELVADLDSNLAHQNPGQFSSPADNDTEAELIMVQLYRAANHEARTSACQFVQKYFLDSPKLNLAFGNPANVLAYPLAWQQLLDAAIENNTHPEVLGAALIQKAELYQSAADALSVVRYLNITAEEYVKLVFTDNVKSISVIANNLSRWQTECPESLRETAKSLAQQASANYGKERLQCIVPEDISFNSYNVTTFESVARKAKKILSVLNNASIGLPFTPTPFTNLSGQTVASDAYQGSTTLLYIWSTQCKPCLESLPKYQLAYEQARQADHPFEMIALNTDKHIDDLNNYLSKHPLPFEICNIGHGSKHLFNWGISGVPGLLLLDEQGILRFKGLASPKLLNLLLSASQTYNQ